MVKWKVYYPLLHILPLSFFSPRQAQNRRCDGGKAENLEMSIQDEVEGKDNVISTNLEAVNERGEEYWVHMFGAKDQLQLDSFQNEVELEYQESS